ncbi:MAG: glycosyltransferase [Candidatus Omnitrophica bacterium]|nr:glycosyltransferase [Candidatus Omnitrophota bacterium]
MGRLVPQKDYFTMFKVVKTVKKSIPNVLLLIAGDGPLRKYMDKLAKKMCIEDNILFLGNIPHSDMPYYFTICDIFVFSSVRESLGGYILRRQQEISLL